MALLDIDWVNVVASATATAAGGWIAMRVAAWQIQATQEVERTKSERECTLEWVEAIDSYVHVAYRGDPLERQRLSRRVLSLAVVCLPDRFAAIQSHIDQVQCWHLYRRLGQRKPLVKFSDTAHFFDEIKSEVFSKVFGQQVKLTPLEAELPDDPVTVHPRP